MSTAQEDVKSADFNFMSSSQAVDMGYHMTNAVHLCYTTPLNLHDHVPLSSLQGSVNS